MTRLPLSRDQRRRLFDRDPVRISGVGECPVKAGDVVSLSSRVSLKVVKVKKQPGNRWLLERYELHDNRDPDLYMRHTPHIAVAEFEAIHASVRETGLPPEPTAEAIADAARESAYTHRPNEGGVVIPADVQARYAKEAQQADAARERRRAARWEAQSLADRVAALESVDNADVSRFLASIERRVQAAEKKVRQRAA